MTYDGRQQKAICNMSDTGDLKNCLTLYMISENLIRRVIHIIPTSGHLQMCKGEK